MKSILKKVTGLALSAALVFGMISCSSEAENNAALIGILNSSKGNSGTPVKETVATPAFSVASGAVDSGTTVTISCATEGAKIYYTTDGTEPTASSTEYKAAISVTAAVTLKAIAVKSGMNDSAVASVSYTIKGTVATPAFSVASGAVDSGTSVTITCSTEGVKIYYTTDGTEPTAETTEYKASISVTAAVTLKAIALKSGMNDSAVASVSYTIKGTVATPAFSVASGAVDSGTTVTISCATEGAKIYYTTDGTEPTAESTEYTSAISVTAAVTLKAIALKSGMNDSVVASVSYTISSGNIPEGFVEVTGTTITGNESWTPSSEVFVSGRSITIPDMYVCDHEVTRGEFKEVMGTDSSAAGAYDKDGNELTGDAVLNNPVNHVNWYAAIAYCNKLSLKENLTPCYSVSGVTDWENLAYSSIPKSRNSTWDALTYDKEADGYRLPTEAEWEWLARGGENYTYAGSNTVGDVAWCNFNTNYRGSREVKTKKANGYGLYDMSGNVYEWCYDWYGTVSSSTADTGASSGSYRVQRGGSCDFPNGNCQVSFRGFFFIPYRWDGWHGFRVVRSCSK